MADQWINLSRTTFSSQMRRHHEYKKIMNCPRHRSSPGLYQRTSASSGDRQNVIRQQQRHHKLRGDRNGTAQTEHGRNGTDEIWNLNFGDVGGSEFGTRPLVWSFDLQSCLIIAILTPSIQHRKQQEYGRNILVHRPDRNSIAKAAGKTQ
jgi:hypothetical protein